MDWIIDQRLKKKKCIEAEKKGNDFVENWYRSKMQCSCKWKRKGEKNVILEKNSLALNPTKNEKFDDF